MLRNILVPLDGSALSECALPYAEGLARRTGASLTLVRAAQRPTRPLGDPAIDTQRAILQAEEYLDSLSRRLVARGLNVQTGVPYGGSAAGWIIEEIRLRCADLVVMASHDRLGPDRWAHGSVAEAVVNGGQAPVMLIRGSNRGSATTSITDGSRPVVVIPLDGSELAEAALALAADLVGPLGAEIVLLCVVPAPVRLVAVDGGVGLYDDADAARLKTEAAAYLGAIVDRVGGGAASVTPLVRVGDAATEIAAVADERAAAAIIMATHGRTGLARSVIGSVAGAVLHRSASPVVLVRSCASR